MISTAKSCPSDSVVSEKSFTEKKPLALYLHLPFCKRKCLYCGFYSIPSPPDVEFSRYSVAIQSEIDLYRRRGLLEGYRLHSLYLGGGTPSYYPLAELETILTKINETFTFSENIEITIEANPDSLTREKLNVWGSWGINRLSLGVQTGQERLLQTLGRPYGRRLLDKVFNMITKENWPELNLDFIYHIPGQSEHFLFADLALIAQLRPAHISYYELTLEDDTPMNSQYADSFHSDLEDKTGARFFMLIDEFLTKRGYDHYEISNYSLPEREARHNLAYWKEREYLGLGAAAASFMKGNRFTNPQDIETYYAAVQSGIPSMDQPETRSQHQVILEQIFLGLRTKNGLDLVKLMRNDTDKISALFDKINEYWPCSYWQWQSPRLRLLPQGWLLTNSLSTMLWEWVISNPIDN